MTTFNADQLANGKAMAQLVAGQPRRIQECVFTAGLVECSYLTSQMHTGDISSATGKQSSSLGWFQQTKAWGSAVARMVLATSLQLFLNGGPDGQRGLYNLDWQNDSNTVPDLCQMVQGSQFDGKTNWPGQGILPWAQNYKDAYPAAVEMLDLSKGATVTTITDMADVLRGAGIPVVELPGWKNTGETDGPFNPIGILFHHDAMGLHNSNVPSYMSQNGNNGSQVWIGYYDGQTPSVVLMAAGRKWHAGLGQGYGDIPPNSGNSLMIGVETDYTGSGPWPQELIDLVFKATAVIKQHYGFNTSNCCGHKEYAPDRKIDPANVDLDAWRAQLSGNVPVVVHPTTPTFPWPPVIAPTPPPALPNLLEEIMALDRNSAEYKALVADIATAVLTTPAVQVANVATPINVANVLSQVANETTANWTRTAGIQASLAVLAGAVKSAVRR